MKNERMYDIGEVVMISVTVVKREFDDRGNIKYRLKDQKSGKIFDWNYTNKDITPVSNKKKGNEE